MVQPELEALGQDAGGAPHANDFTCPSGLDLAATTAVLDFTGTGFALAPQARQLGSVGDGGEGDYATDAGPYGDGGFLTLAAGEHEFASFTLDGATLYSDGDLTLRVTGPVRLLHRANLFVQGHLVIVAGGPITLEGYLYTAGDLLIQQPTDAGITIGRSLPDDPVTGRNQLGGVYTGEEYAGSLSVPAMHAVSPGDIEVQTRGALSMPYGFMYSGPNGPAAVARTGDVTVRAYGDVTLGGPADLDAGTGQAGYFYVGYPPCAVQDDAGSGCLQYAPTGALRLRTEGQLRFDYGSYAYAGHTQRGESGGDLSLRAVGGVRFTGGAFAYAGHAGSVEVLSQGDVALDDDAFLYAGFEASAPRPVNIRARSLALTRRSYIYGGGRGGSVTVATTGDVLLDGDSYLNGANATCAPGGSVTVDAEGSIALTNGGYVEAGRSDPGAACAAAAGGDAVLRAGGAIDAVEPDAGIPTVGPGDGDPAGAAVEQAGAPVQIGLLDAQLEPSTAVAVVSLPQPDASPALRFAAVGPTDPPDWSGAQLLISVGGGAPYLPASDLVGQPLPAGWSYELLLQPRMFDPASVDGVTLRLE